MSLRFCSQAKECWGAEVYFKFGLNKENLKNLLLVRGDSLDLGERRKFLGKFRLAADPYFCPMCGCVNENLFHFVSECILYPSFVSKSCLSCGMNVLEECLRVNAGSLSGWPRGTHLLLNTVFTVFRI
jgi:hypothetical protein